MDWTDVIIFATYLLFPIVVFVFWSKVLGIFTTRSKNGDFVEWK